MNKAKLLISILAILFGAFLFCYGEIDDSPGGQLLGLIIIVVAIIIIIKNQKNLLKNKSKLWIIKKN
ncbi:MAG: hypothetical protein JW816_00840 [Candidatus Buchananbacteria bacterium]|nr:hypothetical protein [Candidatus Buchananbacteria bacterium]